MHCDIQTDIALSCRVKRTCLDCGHKAINAESQPLISSAHFEQDVTTML